MQGGGDMGLGLPPLTRDYISLEICVFTAQNINTLTPLVPMYTLHCSAAPHRENSQIPPWVPQDQSSWECVQAENMFEFKIVGKSKPLKELWGEALIYSNERYWNILLTFPWETTCGSGWVWVMGVWGACILPSAGLIPGKLLCMSGCLLAPRGDAVGHLGEVRHWKDSKFLTWNLTRRLK